MNEIKLVLNIFSRLTHTNQTIEGFNVLYFNIRILFCFVFLFFFIYDSLTNRLSFKKWQMTKSVFIEK